MHVQATPCSHASMLCELGKSELLLAEWREALRDVQTASGWTFGRTWGAVEL